MTDIPADRERPLRVAVALNLAEPHSHHQDVFAGVQQFARTRARWVCVVDECPGYRQEQRAELFRQYDGVIARAAPALQRRLARLGIPLVNTWFQHSRPGTNGVHQDIRRVGEIAAEHLISRGFRRLGVVCNVGNRSSSTADDAFDRHCIAAGGDRPARLAVSSILATERDWFDVERDLAAWLDTLTPPVGICLNETDLVRLLINLCEGRGWRVPQEVAILSLSDNRMIAELSPRITCVDNNFERVGWEAAALLDRIMRGEPPPGRELFVPPRGIVERQSTDYFAMDDEVVAAALRFVSVRLREKLTVQQIAREVAVSTRALQLRFQAALGRPISDEIRRLRLTAARRMLADPEWSIAEIARRAGFGSAVVMNKVFHRELGTSPGRYRKTVSGESAPGAAPGMEVEGE